MPSVIDRFTIVQFPTLEEERRYFPIPTKEKPVYPHKSSAYAFRKHGRNLKRPWAAMVKNYGKLKHIGYFETKEEALRVANETIRAYSSNR
jgi:hypothetical protein